MNNSWQVDSLFEDEAGYSINEYRSGGGKVVDWHKNEASKSSVDFCLNHAGRAEINVSGMRVLLGDNKLALYECRPNEVKSHRYRLHEHHFTTVSLNREYLQDQLAPSQFLLHPEVRGAIYDQHGNLPLCQSRGMSPFDYQWVNGLACQKYIPGPAKKYWGSSKVMELIAKHFFKEEAEQEEFFCDQYKRTSNDRVTAVKMFIEQNYEQPFSLGTLASEVGCSPSYLSRLFSKQVGKSIKLYLRGVRIRNARKMLTVGSHNVTEAAFDCGYNSLSHFAKAFKDEVGCLPSEV